MRRLFLLSIFWFYLLLLPVQAQFAAPTLLPGAVTENPAVIQWGGPSIIGGAYIKGESEQTDSANPATLDTGKSDGYFVGFRLVGKSISLAAHTAEFNGDNFSTEESKFQFSAVALAIPIGDSLTLGIGQEVGSVALQFQSGVQYNLNYDLTLPHGGFSLRLGNVLYLGASFGTESITASVKTTPSVPALEAEAKWERDVRRYGVALYSGNGTKWHLEFGATLKDAATDPVSGISIERNEERTGVFEVLAGGYLFGIKSKKYEEIDETSSPAVIKVTETNKEVTLGWVPEKGWALVLAAGQTDREKGTITQDTKTMSVLLALMF